jgi:hypothetical protein
MAPCIFAAHHAGVAAAEAAARHAPGECVAHRPAVCQAFFDKRIF